MQMNVENIDNKANDERNELNTMHKNQYECRGNCADITQQLLVKAWCSLKDASPYNL